MSQLLPMSIFQIFADVLSEPFLLAAVGVALILTGSLVRWRTTRNRTRTLRSSNSHEITNPATVPSDRVKAYSSVNSPDWDRAVDSGTTDSTFTSQTLHATKTVAASNSISQ